MPEQHGQAAGRGRPGQLRERRRGRLNVRCRLRLSKTLTSASPARRKPPPGWPAARRGRPHSPRARPGERKRGGRGVPTKSTLCSSASRRVPGGPAARASLAPSSAKPLHQYPRLPFPRPWCSPRCASSIKSSVRRCPGTSKRSRSASRLSEFQARATSADRAGTSPVDLGFGEHFLPVEARTFEDAVDTLDEAYQAGELRSLDQRCSHSSFSSSRWLPSATRRRQVPRPARQRPPPGRGPCPTACLARPAPPRSICAKTPPTAKSSADLAQAFQEAVPVLAGPAVAAQVSASSVPDDPAGQRLAHLAPAVVDGAASSPSPLPTTSTSTASSRASLARCRSSAPLRKSSIRQMMANGTFTPHTRMDAPLEQPA